MTGSRVLIVGCGGIGGVLASSLAQLHSMNTELLELPRVVIRDGKAAAHVREHGVRVRGASESFGAPRVLADCSEGDELFDLILLTTQPPHLERAAAQAAPRLAPNGALVTVQNGLCEERLAAVYGEGSVLGAVVAWGGSSVGPGVVERTSPGGFTLGRIDGDVADPRLHQLSTLLSCVGPVEITSNLRGARWSKLAINAAISSLGTLGGERLGTLMKHAFIRRLALEIMSEVVAVAQAEGVRLEKVAGTLDLPWLALTEPERAGRAPAGLMSKHAVLLAVGTRYRKLRSSMLAAIERGQEPAVDFLNGEVVDRGRLHGVDTPVNEAAQRLVHAVARGEQVSSLETARSLLSAVPGL